MKTIGVISDTHGLLRPEALEALRGSDLILHAGDIGAPEVLERLRLIADVAAIKGNNDRAAWSRGIAETATLYVESVHIYMIHNVYDLDFTPSVAERNGVMYLSPGSAGPRRFKLPIAVARLKIEGKSIAAEIITIDVDATTKKSLTSPKPRHIKNSAF